MTQKRAKKGGEIGPNGEVYPGGSFIATTDRPKLSPVKKRTGTGKMEIRPYVWIVPPKEGLRPTMCGIAGIHPIHESGKDLRFTGKLNTTYMNYQFGDDPKRLEREVSTHLSRINAFNAGGVWVDENEVFYFEDGSPLK